MADQAQLVTTLEIEPGAIQEEITCPLCQGSAYEDLRAEFQAAIAANRVALQAALAEQEQRLLRVVHQPLEELRVALQAMLAEQEQRMALEACQLFADIAANRLDAQVALVRQEERIRSLRADVLTQAVQPIIDLRRNIEELQQSIAALKATHSPVAKLAAEDTASIASSILANCDHPNPTAVSTARYSLEVSGWALSHAGIQLVEAYVDGEPRGRIFYGTLRSDVAEAHPGYPDGVQKGFFGMIPVEGLRDGEHVLSIRITARDGSQKELKARFLVDTTWMPVGEVPDINADYPKWLNKHAPRDADIARARIQAAQLTYQPQISLVVPVNQAMAALEGLVDSIRAQTYGNWELLLIGADSNSDEARQLLARLAEAGPRVKVVGSVGPSRSTARKKTRGKTAGPVEPVGKRQTWNAAVEQAKGEFVGLLGHAGVLNPLALFEIARTLNEAPDTDLIYSDEDKVDERSFRWDPFFKPDWSPDLVLSMDYVSHFAIYRRSLLQEIGGVRPGFDGCQDYDLVLRFGERTDRIRHIARILFSRRSTLRADGAEEQAHTTSTKSAERALTEALDRRQLDGHVEAGCAPGRWRVRYALRGQPGVTIVMPSGGKLQYLQPCLQSVLTRTTYPNLQVLVIDNSEGDDVMELCTKLQIRHSNLHCRQLRLKPFNFPAINNFAMQFVETPYLVLFNDDITVITPDWIEAMLEHAQRPEVGVVGTKLLFPNDTIQHAGVILGAYENTGHAFKHFPANDSGYFDLPHVIRNCSAVTFACAMMRRSVYEEVGGLDEVNLRVAFNDVDMCLRIRERGYRVVYTPHAILYHHESVTKKVIVEPGEAEFIRRHWGHVIRHDPFYNPNLTRKGEDYALNMD